MLVTCDDGRARPDWAASDPLLRDYYDTEWGFPVRDEAGVYERLALESFQAGLSWRTVLRKRPALRAAFAGFDPDAVAAFGESDRARLLADAALIRNVAKIDAAITNARATVALRAEGTTLAEVVWGYAHEITPPRSMAEVPSRTAESAALARDLKRRGFRFVGPVTMFALLEAIGAVNTHLVGSWRRPE